LAVRTRGGQTNVLLINDGSRQQTFAVRAQVNGPGTFELLRAPSRRATNGVTLGGQSFGNETRSGRLAGGRNAATIAPVDGVYVVRLPAASAGLLTFAAPRR
jgi:Glycosyl hydrolase family 79 C-terminal beta domain